MSNGHFRKKYRVKNFDQIEPQLQKLGAHKTNSNTSLHYYGQHPGNDVVKLVISDNRSEIHVLDEHDGKFTLSQNIPVTDKIAGLTWLKDKGYSKFGTVKMTHTDYEYGNGLVGLYVINDFLYSVILEYPEGEHEAIARELNLTNVEVINVPYNKYLEQQGRLELSAITAKDTHSL